MSPLAYELRANLDSAKACASQLCAEDVLPADRRMLADQLQHDLAEVERLLPVVHAEQRSEVSRA